MCARSCRSAKRRALRLRSLKHLPGARRAERQLACVHFHRLVCAFWASSRTCAVRALHASAGPMLS